jgi:high-affinity iron transporter
MFEAFVITLREGVEAALLLSIALTILRRRGLDALRAPMWGGVALALALSCLVAWAATRITWNEELAEGIAFLVGAVLVGTLVWWMWRAGPHMKKEIEEGIERATASRSAAIGMFLLAFGMIFREGAETAIFLATTGVNSEGIARWVGGLAGLGLSVAFGVLFARGALRFAIGPFFKLTTAILCLIAIQLLIGGLHELSEAQVLPSSKAEMALIGPIVKSELLIFTLTVALAAGWVLFGAKPPAPAPATTAGPEARLARAAAQREATRRRWTGLVGVAIVGLLAVAFVRGSRVPPPAPARPVPLAGGIARVASAGLDDGHLHFFTVPVEGRDVRFFAIRVGEQLQTCFDACEICGDKGYFEEGGAVVCRNCTSPIALATLGREGGCNPIPLRHATTGDSLAFAAADLRAVIPHLGGK